MKTAFVEHAGRTLRFPDETPQEVIDSVIARDFPLPEPPKDDGFGFSNIITDPIKGFIGSTRALKRAVGDIPQMVTGTEESAEVRAERAAIDAAELPGHMRKKFVDIWSDEGWWEGAKAAVSRIPYGLGAALPGIAAVGVATVAAPATGVLATAIPLVAAAGAFGLPAAHQTYQTALDEGGTAEQAQLAAALMGVAATGLGRLEVGTILKGLPAAGKGKIASVLANGGATGLLNFLNAPAEMIAYELGGVEVDKIEILKNNAEGLPFALVAGGIGAHLRNTYVKPGEFSVERVPGKGHAIPLTVEERAAMTQDGVDFVNFATQLRERGKPLTEDDFGWASERLKALAPNNKDLGRINLFVEREGLLTPEQMLEVTNTPGKMQFIKALKRFGKSLGPDEVDELFVLMQTKKGQLQDPVTKRWIKNGPLEEISYFEQTLKDNGIVLEPWMRPIFKDSERARFREVFDMNVAQAEAVLQLNEWMLAQRAEELGVAPRDFVEAYFHDFVNAEHEIEFGFPSRETATGQIVGFRPETGEILPAQHISAISEGVKHMIRAFKGNDPITSVHELAHAQVLMTVGPLRDFMIATKGVGDPAKWQVPQHEKFVRNFIKLAFEEDLPVAPELVQLREIMINFRNELGSFYEQIKPMVDAIAVDDNMRLTFRAMFSKMNGKMATDEVLKITNDIYTRLGREQKAASSAKPKAKSKPKNFMEAAKAKTAVEEGQRAGLMDEAWRQAGKEDGLELWERRENLNRRADEEEARRITYLNERRQNPYKTKGPRSDEEVARDAAPSLASPLRTAQRVVKQYKSGKAMSDTDLFFMNRVPDILQDSMELYFQGKVTGQEVNKLIADIQGIRTDALSHAGRLLRWGKETKLLELARQITGLDLNEAQKERLRITNWESVDSVRDAYHFMTDAPWGRVVLSTWYNAMLSGMTAAVNFFSNAGELLYLAGHRTLAGTMESIAEKAAGPFGKAPKRTVYAGEGLKMFMTALKEAANPKNFGYAKQVFMGTKVLETPEGKPAWIRRKGASAIDDIATKWDTQVGDIEFVMHNVLSERFAGTAFARPARAFGWFMNLPTSVLAATDIWFKSIAERMQLEADSYRLDQARKRGGGAAVQKELARMLVEVAGDERYAEDVARIEAQGGLEKNVGAAIDLLNSIRGKIFAEQATFQNDPGKFTRKVINARDAANIPIPFIKAAIPAGKMVMPFVSVVSNVAQQGFELTPGLGIFTGMMKGRNKMDILTRQIEASILALALVAPKFMAGELSGPPAANKAEREADQRAGRLPFAVKFGNKWISYERMEPFSMPVALMAGLMQRYQELEASNLDPTKKKLGFAEIGLALGNTAKELMLDSTYFSSFAEVMGKDHQMKRYGANLASSMVPFSSFWRTAKRSMEAMETGGVASKESSFMSLFGQALPPGSEAALGNILGTKQDVFTGQKKVNVFGQEVKRDSSFLREWIPYKWQDEKNDPTESVFQKLGKYPGMPSQVIAIAPGRSVRMPDDVYRDYVVAVGIRTKEAVDKLVSRPSFATLRPEVQLKAINQTFNRLREVERQKVVGKLRGMKLQVEPTPPAQEVGQL